MSLVTYPAKRGDPFLLAGTITLPDGAYTARCQARRPGAGVGVWDLVVTLGAPLDGLTPLRIEASETVTGQWPPGTLQSDVLFIESASGKPIHTDRFAILVEDVVTLAA